MSADVFADKMEQIAEKLADQFLSNNVEAQNIDAFKALSLYLVQTRKLGRKNTDDDEAGFGAVKSAIARASGGSDVNGK